MIKHLICGLTAALAGLSLAAQSMDEWQNQQVNEINRLPMHSAFFPFASPKAALRGIPADDSNYLSLNGVWKFHWVKDANQRPTDFQAPDFNDANWTQMPVPGNWELNGFGDPQYVNIGYGWRGHFDNNPPQVPEKNNHVGTYRRTITIPASWKGKDIVAHFGSVTSNMYLWVNGKFVGYSEDSKLEPEFDITRYVTPGQPATIALQVFRWCDGSYLEDQDFWRLSGIARDCYLFAQPRQRITDIRVTPDLTNNYTDGSLRVNFSLKGAPKVNLVLRAPDGSIVAKASTSGGGSKQVVMNVANPLKWTAETPNLYTLTATVISGKSITEVIPVRTGFRKVEMRNGQLCVNGQPIIIKGVNRHELDPDGGYVVSRQRMLQDLRIMKEHNINAVRTSHYPNDNQWYELCDSLGFYLVGEANLESHGMGYGPETLALRPEWELAHRQRNERNVARNFNHPSVIIWSMGNEAGDGPNFEHVYDWIKDEDPSRPVQYERAGLNRWTDIYCPMYAYPDWVSQYANRADSYRPIIQCEYNHAMGNSGGGFKEYMDLTRKDRLNQGGFIWDFVDQGLRGTGRNGKMIYTYGGDFNSYDASDNNFCDNGLISPDRIPHPHMEEVKHQYQSIWTSPVDMAKGQIAVRNENFFTDLSNYYLRWTLLANGEAIESGVITDINVPAQASKEFTIPYTLPEGDAELLLNLDFLTKQASQQVAAGHLQAYNQLEIAPRKASDPALMPSTSALKVDSANKGAITVSSPELELQFVDGFIRRYNVGSTAMLAPEGAITPAFWRAPTDNNYGAQTPVKRSLWRNPQMTLLSASAETRDGNVVVKTIFDMPDVKGQLLSSYEINSQGQILLTQTFTPNDSTAEVPEIERFGIQVEMPKTMDLSTFYGRGPIENYADRRSAARLGRYSLSAAEQAHPYIRPQETGTKSDVRYWLQSTPGSGHGLLFTAPEPFYGGATNYSITSLDDGDQKHQSHFQEVNPVDYVNLLIDSHQAGVGGVDSWGALPLKPYRLPYGPYTLRLLITPR